jgi:hypothetical protein
MKKVLFILSCCFALTAWGDEDRIWVDAKINGQSVRMAFDTCADTSILLRGTAERLKLKLIPPQPGLKPAPGFVSGPLTEPCDLVWGHLSDRTQFGVIELPPLSETRIDGLLSWRNVRSNVLVFDAIQGLNITESVPARAKVWQKFKQRSDLDMLGFELDGGDATGQVVYVDTGDDGGIALGHSLWEKWVASRADQTSTMVAFGKLPAGMLVKRQLWADMIALGPLVFTNVPVREFDRKEESSAMPNVTAVLGLYALRRLDLVVDGKRGVVYAQPRGDIPLAYAHNQLGAVFVPKDEHDDSLIAHVGPGSPAHLVGIRDGDVLLKIDELDVVRWRTTPKVMPLRRFWCDRPPGTTYRLTLKRGGNEYQTTVTLKRILAPAEQSMAVTMSLDELRAKADQGDAQSEADLGTIYLFGNFGVAKDEIEAVKWYRQAAEKNVADAQYNLGVCQLKGLGVAKDEVEGYKWVLLAARQGNQNALNILSTLSAQMNRATMAEAQKRAAEFKPRVAPSSHKDHSDQALPAAR